MFSTTTTTKPERSKIIQALKIAGVSATVATVGYVGYIQYVNRPITGELPKNRKKLVILGSGWGAVSILSKVDPTKYEAIVVSPRNYFLFTPLLPSCTVGTLEARSLVEPIRALCYNRQAEYVKAKAVGIDSNRKVVKCLSTEEEELDIEYDKLVIAIGARNITFGTPGVEEFCYFLKEIKQAIQMRHHVLSNFERASLPTVTAEEKKKLLSFVIVGGGATGIEYAAELRDFITQNVSHQFPKINTDELVTISIIQSGDAILNTFDKRISEYAEKNLRTEKVDVITQARVQKIEEDSVIYMDKKTKKEIALPYGLCLWATGIGPRQLTSKIIENHEEQTNRRALLCDPYFRVKGLKDIYAVGDCATIDRPQLLQKVNELFEESDTNHDDGIDREEFKAFVSNATNLYPQLESQLTAIEQTFEEADMDHSNLLSREEFKQLLFKLESETKALPATAQVAAQAGDYLAHALNDEANDRKVKPFKYQHLGSLSYVGGENAVIDLGSGVIGTGAATFWLWKSIYLSEQVSLRTRCVIVVDWIKSWTWGRDTSTWGFEKKE